MLGIEVQGQVSLTGRKRKTRKKKRQTVVTRPHECHFFIHCVSLSLSLSM